MDLYLTTLVSQIAGSYAEGGHVRTVVDAGDVILDISRATTAGLIINELVTNSFKYAFPPGFDCEAERGEACTIRVSLVPQDGSPVLTVADNGKGFPEGFDPLMAKSLGLKLVTFLARHQLPGGDPGQDQRGRRICVPAERGRRDAPESGIVPPGRMNRSQEFPESRYVRGHIFHADDGRAARGVSPVFRPVTG